MSIFKPLEKDKSLKLSPSSPHKIPSYLRKVYHWAYLNPKNIKLLDNELIVSTLLWGNHQQLRNSLLKEILPGDTVLQPAAVYGDFSSILANQIGHTGKLDVVDIAPIQVTNTQKKLQDCKNTTIRLADAAEPFNDTYDVIACYFLLHEIPDNYKLAVMNNLISCLSDRGKLVVIDYHKPHWAHPIKPITNLIFNTLEPYAKSLWWHPIEKFVFHPEQLRFEKSTFFEGLYQKVVITKQAWNT